MGGREGGKIKACRYTCTRILNVCMWVVYVGQVVKSPTVSICVSPVL